MKKILVILCTIMFCLWFGQVVVNADVAGYDDIDVEYEEKQELDDVKITIYYTSFFFKDSYYSTEDIFILTIESRPEVCESESHLGKNVKENGSDEDVYLCENGCLIDKTTKEEYENTSSVVEYGEFLYTHKKEYSLNREFFDHDSGKIVINTSTHSTHYDDNELILVEHNYLMLDYKIEDGYIYISKFEYKPLNVNNNSMNCQ